MYQANEIENKKPEELIKYEGKGFATDYFGNKYYQYGNGYRKISKETTPKNNMKIQNDKIKSPLVNEKNLSEK